MSRLKALTEMDYILALLEEGEAVYEIGDHSQAVIVLGPNSSKSSAFVQYMTEGIDEKEFKKIYYDNSKKDPVYPEIASEPNATTVYYNCPMLSVHNDLVESVALSYMTKKVIDGARSIKLLFVVDYEQIINDLIITTDFINMAKYTVELFEDVQKFEDSIALVVTGVDRLTSADDLLEKVVSSLKKMKALLNTLQTHTEILPVIDIFLEKQKNLVYLGFDMQKERKDIREIMQDNLDFTLVVGEEVRYVIEKNTVAQMKTLHEEIMDEIVREINVLGMSLQQYYQYKEQVATDINLLHSTFKYVTETAKELEMVPDPQEFVKILIEKANTLHIKLPRANLQHLSDDIKHLALLETIGGFEIDKGTIVKQGMATTFLYLRNSISWYGFLGKLQQKLSTYNIQLTPEKYYKLTDLRQQCEEAKGTINISSTDLNKFLAELGMSLKDRSVNDEKMKMLGKLMDFQLNYAIEQTCTASNRLVVKGTYVRTGLVEYSKCSSEVKYLEIYAADTVFFDTDIIKQNTGFEIVVIAPKWEVIGTSRKIDLTGTPTNGHFNGFLKDVVNGGSLKIEAWNKKVNKYPHTDCLNPDLTFKYWDLDGLKYSRPISLFKTAEEWRSYPDYKFLLKLVEVYKASPSFISYRVYNQSKREDGVLSESVHFLKLDSKNKRTAKISEDPKYFELVCLHFKVYIDLYSSTLVCNPRMGPGVISYCNEVGGKAGTLYSELLTILNNFSSYYREYLSENYVTRETSLEFMSILNGNDEIRKKYGVKDFIDEFLHLERQYYKLGKQINFFRFYEELLVKLDAFGQGLEDNESNLEYRKVLSYLYTSVKSKLYSIKTDSNLVIDTKGFISLSFNNIVDLAKVIEKEDAVKENEEYRKMIETENQKYRASIAASISEAKELVETYVVPEIEKLIDKMSEQINKLTEEVIELEKQGQEKLKELEAAKKKLESQIGLNAFLTGLRSAVLGVASIFGVEESITGFVDIGKDLLEKWLIGDKPDPDLKNLLQLPEGIQNSINQISGEINADKALAILQLTDAREHLNSALETDSSGNLETAAKKIEQFKKELEEDDPFDENAMERYENLRQEILKLLEAPKQRSFSTVIAVVNTIFRIGIDVYNQVREDKQKIEKISNAIDQVKEKLEDLAKYKQIIHKVISPMCQQLGEIASNLQSQIKDKSHVALDITKWSLQNYIKDIKRNLESMTAGFNVQHELLDTVDKLDSAMSIMITVYDRIQTYYDQSKLVEYIAAVNSKPALQAEIKDADLRKGLDDLNEVMRANMVLGQYHRSMTAYKQFAFPFAEYYLDEFSLPSSLMSDYLNNTSVLAAKTEDKLRKMYSKLEENEVTIGEYDKYIFSYIGFTCTDMHGPFMTWENQLNQQTISQLFSGKQITIKAGILDGFNYNAMKTTVARVHFKAKEDALQDGLEKALLHFQVEMTHLGDSTYRCGEKFYTIGSDPQTLIYSFEKDANGYPSTTNLVYDKLCSGNFLLSPYATWNIKLKNLSSPYDILDYYKDKVDMELEGYGQCILQGDFNSKVCYNLDDYYDVDDTISELFKIDVSDEAGTKHKRSVKRRSRRDIETEERATSSAAGFHKNSPVTKIFDFLVLGVSVLQNLVSFENMDDTSYAQFSEASTPWMECQNCYEQIDDSSSPIGTFMTISSISSNSNLLLFDTLIRKVTGVKNGRSSMYQVKPGGCNIGEYASNLAYKYYAPQE